MSRRISIEAECIVSQLDYPRYIDHAWLSIASNIHRRLFELTPEDSYVQGGVLNIEKLDERRYRLEINSALTWTDSACLQASEVASALDRGKAFGLIQYTTVEDSGNVLFESCEGVEFSEALLGSCIFTLTPSCRALPRKNVSATCGEFSLQAASSDRRIMKFVKRPGIDMAGAPDEVTVVVTESRSQGIRLLNDHQIDLTCPLGAEPYTFNVLKGASMVVNRMTNLVMVLRAYPGSEFEHNHELLHQISNSIDRGKLSKACGKTLLPVYHIDEITQCRDFSSHAADCPTLSNCASSEKYTGPPSFELRYVLYEPNLQIAKNLQKQLEEVLSVCITLKEVSYYDYIQEVFDKSNGLSLEIIQSPISDPFLHRLWAFIPFEVSGVNGVAGKTQGAIDPRPCAIPLLRNSTTLLSYNSLYTGRKIVTREAIVPWKYL